MFIIAMTIQAGIVFVDMYVRGMGKYQVCFRMAVKAGKAFMVALIELLPQDDAVAAHQPLNDEF